MKCQKIYRVLFILLGFILISGCGGNADQSNNWKVVIESAKWEKKFGVGPNRPDGLVVGFELYYLGADGKSSMPHIYLLRDGEKVAATHAHFDKEGSAAQMNIIQAMLGGKKLFDLKKGEPVTKGKTYLIFEISKNRSKYEFVVGDIDPVRIRP